MTDLFLHGWDSDAGGFEVPKLNHVDVFTIDVEADSRRSAGRIFNVSIEDHDFEISIGHILVLSLMRAERPALLAPNVACVDYSVTKGGHLCA